jgi:cytoskeleton protein RodZ
LSHGGDRRKERLSELGSRVRARREELGLSVEQCAEKTKIRSRYLIAVEEGDDSVSPGQTYFRAFLKTYASFLGLDGSALSAEYRDIITQAESGQPGKPSRSPLPVPQMSPDAQSAPSAARQEAQPGIAREVPPAAQPAGKEVAAAPPASRPRPARPRRRVPGERRRRGGAVWVFLALAAVAAVAYYMVVVKPASQVPPSTAGTEEPPDVPVTGTEQDPEPPGPVEEPPAPVVTREDPDDENTIWSVDRTPIELELKVHGNSDSYCWVSVWVDGKPSFERTLTPEEVVNLTATSRIWIRAGKPWVMDVVINGEDMGPAGEFGPVKDLVIQSRVSPETAPQ